MKKTYYFVLFPPNKSSNFGASKACSNTNLENCDYTPVRVERSFKQERYIRFNGLHFQQLKPIIDFGHVNRFP